MMTSSPKKTILITGAGSGVGYALALETAKLNYHVFVSCRTQGKAEIAIQKLMEESALPETSFTATPSLDLDNFDTVRAFVAKFDHKLDALVLNAGSMNPHKEISPSGIEITYSGKVVGHHVLTMELVRKNSFNENAIIVFVGSEGSTGLLSGMSYPNFQKMAEKKTGGDLFGVFVASMKGDESITGKYSFAGSVAAANGFGELWCLSLAPRFAQKSIKIFATSPGSVLSTGITRNFPWIIQKILRVVASLVVGNQTPEFSVKNRFLPFLLTPEKFESGRFYASPPGKAVGPLTLQDTPHLLDRHTADIVVRAIESVSATPSSV